MPSKIWTRLTYANVMSSLAVFLVLTGGTAVALSGSDSVFSDDIKDGQVKNEDLGGSSVGPGKIRDESLTGQEIAPNSVGGVRIEDRSLANADIGLSAITASRIASNAVGKSEIDATQVQRRTGGTCSSGSAFRVINRDGSVVCTQGPRGLSAHDDATGVICRNAFCKEGTLSVPAGSYAISAKITLAQGFGDESVVAECRLTAGNDFDTAHFWDFGEVAIATLPMQVVHTFGSGGSVIVRCADYGAEEGQLRGANLKITAIRLGTVSNVKSEQG